MVYVCVVGKMAQDVGMVRSTAVSFLPCFAAFREFHSYMHLFSYQNLWHLFLLFCFCFKERGEGGRGGRGERGYRGSMYGCVACIVVNVEQEDSHVF